ncbi:NnrU family protein [Sphingomicrobium astaxanthinifaciens]|uniref:NnrU family protein n=1 Tax=Sphingomicrobium astaxanthinifaciens TaxID=1227949 RepID=UPI001FCBDD25|nr:NnrU family protein [Sphingomicrobium astaxanthinifaciens]MCJ7420337.1 NnrU family protein [Sphingomicrobium astaxanthinifaciens]
MSPEGWLALWAAAFAGSHLVMSHPLRAPLVRTLSERGFLGTYSLVSLFTLVMTVRAYGSARAAGPPMLWQPGEVLWALVSLVMWGASVLLVGAFRRNPALPHPGAAALARAPAKGVYAITRHPMLWSFALWALAHVAINPTLPSLILSTAILFLSLVGAAGQDVKKRRLMGPAWADWAARTSFVPFGRQLAAPDGFALIGGTLLFLAATYGHGLMGASPAGVWRWL